MISVHPAHGAEWLAVRGSGQRLRINLVGIGVHPALSLILEVVGGPLRGRATVVTFDYAEGQIDAGGEAARTGQIGDAGMRRV